MRLIDVHTFLGHEFFGEDIPQYAILSHTWDNGEVLFDDLVHERYTNKPGFEKLRYFSQQAAQDGLQYIWMDSCCIDKRSSAELTEAVNSMYRWYRNARACYVYLADVSKSTERQDDNQWISVTSPLKRMSEENKLPDETWKLQFQSAKWFKRGWTLQELIAPESVLFFSKEWLFLGDKRSLEDEIQKITGIDGAALRGRSLTVYTVEERMSWAEKRETTRLEDAAYCLLGIFDVNIPLIYGEGEAKAFRRLAEEIAKTTRGYKFVDINKRAPGLEVGRGIGIKLVQYLAREPSDYDDDRNQTNTNENPADIVDSSPGKKSEPNLLNRIKGNLGLEEDNRNNDDNDDDDDDDGGDGDRDRIEKPSSRLAESQLRILHLEPGVIGDRLIGRVEEFGFSDAPPYYALSYPWGQEPDLHPIFLSKKSKLIRSNLFYALQRIRLRSGPINIWIDSICINQQDELERNSQVRQMADIYQNAVGVLIWLGEEDSTSKLAMDLIDTIVQRDYSWRGPWWEDYGFVALAQILERPWFRRRWVIQEAAMSSNSTVYCGDRQVHMSTFAMAVNLVRARLSTTTPSDIQINQASPVAFLANFRDSPAVRLLDTIEGAFRRSDEGLILHRRLSLETLVDLARFSDTSDHRDTIYSLLSLARDATALRVDPDYSKTVLDVYSDFICHCINSSGSLDIICRPWAPIISRNRTALGHKLDESDSLPLPSWIATRDRLPFGDPSLRLTQRLHGNPLVGSSQKRVYNCHFGTEPRARIGRNLHDKWDGSLHVTGFVLGKVAKRSMRMANAMITKECLQLLGSVTQNLSPRPFSVPDVMWRTICADRDDKGDPAPPFYRSAMTHLLQLSSEVPDGLNSTNILDNLSSIDVEELLDADLNDHVRTFLEIVRDVIWNRKTFQTHPEMGIDGIKRPFVGLIPQSAKIGDRVCIIYGCSVPVVLRKKVQPMGCWQLIGDAYVDGIMDGELIQFAPPHGGESALMEFELR